MSKSAAIIQRLWNYYNALRDEVISVALLARGCPSPSTLSHPKMNGNFLEGCHDN